MNKVVLINCYFGKFPNYFELWLESAKNNTKFDFLIITDNKVEWNYSNVKFINMEFNELRSLIQNKFDFKIILTSPYKLCDYKPLYGMVLSEYIKDYEFWGYVDLDLILGDLSSFITDECLRNVDKINKLGHFEIYKNCNTMNELYKIDNHSTIYNYKKVYRTKLCCHFDEHHGVSTIAENEPDIKIKNIDDYFDVDYRFWSFRDVRNQNLKCIFKYFNKKLFMIYVDENENIKYEEKMYVHLQKRKMYVDEKISLAKYYIIPNSFTNNFDETVSKLKKITADRDYTEWDKKKKAIFFDKIKNNAVQEKIYRIIRKKYLEIKYHKKINMK